MTRKALVWAAACMSICLSGAPVQAQQLDLTQGGPIDVTAKDGIEWRQAERKVIARGDAKAVRGAVTVTADRLTAWYRKKAGTAPGDSRPDQKPQVEQARVDQSQADQPRADQTRADQTRADQTRADQTRADQTRADQSQAAGLAADSTSEGNEIYRLQADGNVHIYTQTDQAQGDRATYDLDQAVLVLNGRNLKLTTPNDVLTARDDLEYWPQKRMSVARGNAVVVTNDAKRVAADTLVAYMKEAAAPPPGTPPPPRPAAKPGADAAPQDPLAASGKLERVEAFGNVSIRTPTDTVTGDRGVYVPDTGMARLAGNVRITRGQNQLNGQEADVNMKTGVATLLAAPSGRVRGLVTPNDESNKSLGQDPLAKTGGQSKPAPQPTRLPAPPAATGTQP